MLRAQRSQPRGPTLLTSTSTCTTSTDRIGEARWRPAPTGCGTRTARRLPKTGHCATLRDAALSAFMRDPGHARRGRSGRAPTGGWGRTPGAACWARRAGRRTRGTARQARNKWCREDVLPRRRGPPLAPRSPPARPPLRELPKQRPAWSSTIRAGSFETLLHLGPRHARRRVRPARPPPAAEEPALGLLPRPTSTEEVTRRESSPDLSD